MASKQNNRRSQKTRIDLLDLGADDQRPDLAVYAVDRSNQLIEAGEVNEEGEFKLSDKALKKAHQVIIGPQVEDLSSIPREQLTIYRASQFNQVMKERAVFEIPRVKWSPWFHIRRCVSGSVTHCYPYPELVRESIKLTRFGLTASNINLRSNLSKAIATQLSDAGIAQPQPFRRLHRCDEVCDGLVEVYRRTCCCEPWIIYDPRFEDLIWELEEWVREFPPEPWPPQPEPGPDPAPFERPSFFKSGTLNEKSLRAEQDLSALRSLPSHEISAYVTARPYLFCHCGSPHKVGEGFIRPNGEFTVCWSEWPRYMLINCHEEYAYIVKQVINSSTVTIYDGVTANKWFHYNDHAELVSHHHQAQSCRHNEFPEAGAVALLQDIGLTPSYRLKTPDANGWDSVGTPVYNDGLAYPATNAAAAKGKYLDRNWGGALRLRYYFSEDMKGIGAKYYRVSVVAADANGNPTGDRTYLSPGEWSYYEHVGAILHVKKTSLGPHSAGTQNDLYEIPYDADRAWHSGQYHAMLNTTQFANKRHLLMVEVFNNAGQLLRPTGTTNPGGSTEAAFSYRRWFQETGPTAEVPYAALTHMFWWDNRKAKANIIDLRVNSAPNIAQCQFLVAAAGTPFSMGYRAYHEQPMFMLDHRIWWRRGLGGPSGILTSPHPNPDCVGVPPAPAHESGSNTFATMLAGLSNPKCSFSANLHVNVKTFNGIGTLNGLDAWDQAAFALEMIT